MSYDRDLMSGDSPDTFAKIARSALSRTAHLVASKLDSRQQGTAAQEAPVSDADIYESLYEAHAQIEGDETVVGDLSLGRIELEIVQDHGLKPDHTLVDLGCGIGRLASEVVSYLSSDGAYIGTDVSHSLLARAKNRLADLSPPPACSVSWSKQLGNIFPMEEDSVDMICAFSVFTHIEHEDAYALLRDGRRIVRPGGKFVFSCLPMDLSDARYHFWRSAQMSVTERWSTVRNVTTSMDLMNTILAMAGWEPDSWTTGNPDRFGQSVCSAKPLPDDQLERRPNPWEL